MDTGAGPDLAVWKPAVAELGARLVDLETDLTVELARAGQLEGTTASSWDGADAGLATAWRTYDALNDLLAAVEAGGEQGDRLRSARVPSADGPTDPAAALDAARAAVEAAADLARTLAVAWQDLAPRVDAARATAAAVGDAALEQRAGDLRALLARDPLLVREPDVAAVEEQAAEGEVTAGRAHLDLLQARDTLRALTGERDAAQPELAYAASRIAGVPLGPDVAAVDDLARRLDRIEGASGADPVRAAGEVDGWAADATRCRQDLDGALATAREGMRRRELGRGLWKALQAKATARQVGERPEVSAALDAARDLLWTAPCDLDAAEGALARLGHLIDDRPGPPGGGQP